PARRRAGSTHYKLSGAPRVMPCDARKSPGRLSGQLVAGAAASFVPRLGSRKTVGLLPAPLRFNMLRISPADASNEPAPRRLPPSQLSSITGTREACVIGVWPTKFPFAHGEIIRNGVRVPGPQRPLTAPPLMPSGCVAPVPVHWPWPDSWSAPVKVAPAIVET